MNQPELLRKLDQLLELPHETEWVEFKEAMKKAEARRDMARQIRRG